MKSKKPIAPEDAHVLIVEDNMQNTILISRILDFIGVRQYEWKASGWQVLDIADQMPQVDLVLLDLHLPYEDGYEILTKIRSHAALTHSIVVAVTADAHPETMKKAKEAGFDGFIGKPINSELFPEQIKDILQGKSVWEVGSTRML